MRGTEVRHVYRARDQVDNRRWLEAIDEAADALDVDDTARIRAHDLFLTDPPGTDRSNLAVVAASLYAGCLIEGDHRSQAAVARTVGVTRLAVQQRWKRLLKEAGLEPPRW